jgi:imidazolonepropionase
MRAAGTVPCCCPAPSTFLRETRLPPITALRAHGVPMALASDHNPGSSPGLSLLLMLNMACTLFRMTPQEARARRHAACRARAGPADRGRLAPGSAPISCVWDLDHPQRAGLLVRPQPLPPRGGRQA